MDSRGAGLSAHYGEAIRIGDHLLQLLRAPTTDQDFGRINELVRQREAVVQQTAALIARGERVDEALAELQLLVEQQRILEEQFRRLLRTMEQASVGIQAARDSLQGVGRLLKSGPQSRWLDERR